MRTQGKSQRGRPGSSGRGGRRRGAECVRPGKRACAAECAGPRPGASCSSSSTRPEPLPPARPCSSSNVLASQRPAPARPVLLGLPWLPASLPPAALHGLSGRGLTSPMDANSLRAGMSPLSVSPRFLDQQGTEAGRARASSRPWGSRPWGSLSASVGQDTALADARKCTWTLVALQLFKRALPRRLLSWTRVV